MEVLETAKYLTISGGGARGISFLSAVEILIDICEKECNRDFLQDLKGAAGTSIGCIVTLVCICCTDLQALKKHFLNEKTWSNNVLFKCLDITGLLRKKGFCSPQVLYDKVDEIFEMIGLPTDIDFVGLYNQTGKEFKCNSSCEETLSVNIMSKDTTPYLSVKKAICMSMCMPFVFEPIQYREMDHVDGAYYQNYIPTVFPSDEVIGIRIDDTCKSVKYQKKEGFCWFTSMITSQGLRNDQLQFEALSPAYQKATITVYTPKFGPGTLSVDKTNINYLYNCGQISALWYLKRDVFLAWFILKSVLEFQKLLLAMEDNGDGDGDDDGEDNNNI